MDSRKKQEPQQTIEEIQGYLKSHYQEFDEMLIELFKKASMYQEEIAILRANIASPINIDHICKIQEQTKLMRELVCEIENQRHHLRRLRESLTKE